MFKRILLPVEDSDVSRRAAALAIALSKDCHAHLLALHVVLPERADPFVPGRAKTSRVQDDMAVAEQCIEQVRALAEEAGVACDGSIMNAGEVWEAICQAALDKACDLIVMGSHGRHGLTRLLLGSSTQSVLAHSEIPVLVCP